MHIFAEVKEEKAVEGPADWYLLQASVVFAHYYQDNSFFRSSSMNTLGASFSFSE